MTDNVKTIMDIITAEENLIASGIEYPNNRRLQAIYDKACIEGYEKVINSTYQSMRTEDNTSVIFHDGKDVLTYEGLTSRLLRLSQYWTVSFEEAADITIKSVTIKERVIRDYNNRPQPGEHTGQVWKKVIEAYWDKYKGVNLYNEIYNFVDYLNHIEWVCKKADCIEHIIETDRHGCDTKEIIVYAAMNIMKNKVVKTFEEAVRMITSSEKIIVEAKEYYRHITNTKTEKKAYEKAFELLKDKRYSNISDYIEAVENKTKFLKAEIQ